MIKNKSVCFLTTAVFVIILMAVISSCKTQKQQLMGSWENKDQTLSFNQQGFILRFNEKTDLQVIYGTYEFAQEPANVIKLYYKSYCDASGIMHSFEGTDLENYVDYLMYQISGSRLTTRVLANDIFFTYSRVEK